MVRLLLIADFTEQFPYKLLRGVLDYSRTTEPWAVSKMPLAFKEKYGMEAVAHWALKWQADVVIGQFEEGEEVSLLTRHGIVVIAKSYKTRSSTLPGIVTDDLLIGRMAAEHFLSKGFRNFAFFGYPDVCWSDGRCRGFRVAVTEAGYGNRFHLYDSQQIDNLWYYESARLEQWLRSLPVPTAVLSCDDNQGNVLVDACNIAGLRIPFDIAVLGVDNDEVLCNLSVLGSTPLSSIQVDIERGGYEVAALAERLLHHPDAPREDIVLHPLTVVGRASSTVFATEDPDILKALHFIHQNVDRRIGVEDLLTHVPLSRRLLEIRFRKATGDSVYNYISRQRVERFAQLLMEGNDPIIDIAARMDEPDTKTLSRRFKEFKGCTPSQFRARRLRKIGK